MILAATLNGFYEFVGAGTSSEYSRVSINVT